MKPRTISYSSLTLFENCGWAYFNDVILKRYKDTKEDDKDAGQKWGDVAHKAFELRQSIREPLPEGLAEHETYMKKLAAYGDDAAIIFTELKGGLDTNLEPVEFFSKDPFMRVIIDFLSVVRNGESALSVDYKTGKYRDGMEKQLMMNAIFVWHLFPKVNIVDSRYYWTQTMKETRHVYSREQEPDFWDVLIPTIQLYKEAHKKEIWTKRPNFLCKGFCKTTDCEHWEPKRHR